MPDAQFAKFSFIDNVPRQKYHSMVNWIDGAIGRVVQAIKTKGLYDNMLIVFSRYAVSCCSRVSPWDCE
jgi:arylsulfatase A-like enzyme